MSPPTADISTLLAGSVPLPGHRPWPRHVVDAATWTAAGEALGAGQGDLFGLWAEREAVHLLFRTPSMPSPCVISLPVTDGGYPSIGRHHAPAVRFERAIHVLHGLVARDAPDLRPWLDHGAWDVSAPLGAADGPSPRDSSDEETPRDKDGLQRLSVGPEDALVGEPGLFRFIIDDERVVRLEPRLGYAHKGIEGLLTDVDLPKAQRIVARVSGDSTVAYSFAFARAVEAALDIDVPERALALRGVMAELERIANHFGDIGAICNDAALPVIQSYCGIFRERILSACDSVFSHRLMMDEIVPGGVMQNVSAAGVAEILRALDEIEPQFARIIRLYDNLHSFENATCGAGIVATGLAKTWGAGGLVGRASGRDFDARRDLAYAPYAGMAWAVPVLVQGGVDARVRIRIREVEESIGLLRRWLAGLPQGAVLTDIPRLGEAREGVAVVEGFRGEVLVWLRLDAAGRVALCHLRDPSWFQWPLLEAAMENNSLADFPLCRRSFNCSSAGHDL